jgi:glycosyltransferase involved in cell wall biosynthesis
MDEDQKPSQRSGWAYLGRISPEKNVIGLLRAANSLPEKLTLYGPVSPPNARFERHFLRELERSNAEWRGPVPAEDVRSVLSKHRVFVNPSYTEGLPFTVLEAAAEGLYLVLSDIRPHRLLGFPACSYVNPEKLEFEPLRSLPADGGQANRAYVRLNYDIRKTLSSHARLYHELANQSWNRTDVTCLSQQTIEEVP